MALATPPEQHPSRTVLQERHDFHSPAGASSLARRVASKLIVAETPLLPSRFCRLNCAPARSPHGRLAPPRPPSLRQRRRRSHPAKSREHDRRENARPDPRRSRFRKQRTPRRQERFRPQANSSSLIISFRHRDGSAAVVTSCLRSERRGVRAGPACGGVRAPGPNGEKESVFATARSRRACDRIPRTSRCRYQIDRRRCMVISRSHRADSVRSSAARLPRNCGQFNILPYPIYIAAN